VLILRTWRSAIHFLKRTKGLALLFEPPPPPQIQSSRACRATGGNGCAVLFRTLKQRCAFDTPPSSRYRYCSRHSERCFARNCRTLSVTEGMFDVLDGHVRVDRARKGGGRRIGHRAFCDSNRGRGGRPEANEVEVHSSTPAIALREFSFTSRVSGTPWYRHLDHGGGADCHSKSSTSRQRATHGSEKVTCSQPTKPPNWRMAARLNQRQPSFLASCNCPR
jgi:hypothetical protein